MNDPAHVYGLTRGQGAWLMSKGWPEAHLRSLQRELRSFDCAVDAIVPSAIYGTTPDGFRVATYRDTDATYLRDVLADLSMGSDGREFPEVSIWTDGSGNRAGGHAGAGVVIEWPGRQEELSEYIGVGTNNFAELTAIWIGLQRVLCLDVPVRVVSDSEYAIGSLTLPWRAQANALLIAMLREDVRRRKALRFDHVHGHVGIPLNELADRLAGEGRRKGMPPKAEKVKAPARKRCAIKTGVRTHGQRNKWNCVLACGAEVVVTSAKAPTEAECTRCGT